jgi:hypothetical protein
LVVDIGGVKMKTNGKDDAQRKSIERTERGRKREKKVKAETNGQQEPYAGRRRRGYIARKGTQESV